MKIKTKILACKLNKIICLILFVSIIPLTNFNISNAVNNQSSQVQKNKPNMKVKGNKVIILAYHCINDEIYGTDYLFVSPSEFEKQMKYLKDNKYSVISLDKINDAENIKNPVVITFDDVYEDNYTYAYPILKKYNFRATVFIVLDLLDRPLFFKKDMLKEASDVFSFQSHTMDHKKLSKLKQADLQYQLSESQKRIYELTNQKVSALAYPYGDFNEKVEIEAKKYYKTIFTVKKGYFKKGDSLTRIPRISIKRNDTIDDFKKILSGKSL